MTVSLMVALLAQTPQVARWSSEPRDAGSPACFSSVKDTFIQYADLEGDAALRFCLWWHLGKPDFPDVGCWRVDLGSGTYEAQTGVWFSAAQPLRVGAGGPALPARTLESRWADG
ncbi:MAG TPA: hypothetical protein VH208_05715, partial [Myxococcaceae bacterium]|nr:hypothetical protein [Myxococcaceae bacterium]